MNSKETQEFYDFVLELDVVNEYAAGIWADYVTYCIDHDINTEEMQHPMAVKTQEVFDIKSKIYSGEECKNMEDIEQIKESLITMKQYLQEVEELG